MPVSDKTRGIALMLLAMLAFAINDTIIKLLLADMPLPQAMVVRGVPACTMLGLLAWRAGAFSHLPKGRDRKFLILRSFGEVAGTLTFLGALTHMQLANVTAILQSVPLAATAAAALFLGEKVGWRRALAVAIGFIGVLIVIRPGEDGLDPWAFLVLLSVACVVCRDLITRQISRDVPAALVGLGAAIMVLTLSIVWSAFVPWQPVTPRHLLLALVGGFFMTMAFVSLVGALQSGDVSMTAPLRYSQLLWATLLGWLVFDHLPDIVTLAGAALIVASGVFTILREARRNR
ncbi:DMT family transporter [Pseudomonas sp. GX19020]|uniref:DMT family transporter n=1 Tax=Pseudomonas sp. GX19020 TaxID=2942277 RepID=UPI0020197977|nr:DMT family transporter [Pseudomonas sp. GX19020]MCL4069041.1 DMT family transporter [Pseudomonas sp. GX19020]